MANGVYEYFKQLLLTGDLDIVDAATNIKAGLIRDTDYTPNFATHQDLADVNGGTLVATSGNFSSKTGTAGAFDAADITFTSVAAGAAIDAIVIFYDTGTASTSTLIAYIDTGTGLPVTPNGGNITVQWDGSPNFIFKL